MGNKATQSKDKIIKSALSLFLTKGYESTSMRDVSKNAGCAVGLAYNYFKTKDDLFKEAMELFFENYKHDFSKIVNIAYRNPFQAITIFFNYIKEAVIEFRQKFEKTMHWTVRWAIRERSLYIIESYLEEVINILVSWGFKPKLDKKLTSLVLTHGVGSVLLHEDIDVNGNMQYNIKDVLNLIMGYTEEFAALKVPVDAEINDISSILSFISSNENLYKSNIIFTKEIILDRIHNENVILIKRENIILGLGIVNKDKKEIEYLVVNEKYQRKGLGTRLLITALSRFNIEDKVTMDIVFNASYFSFMKKFKFVDVSGKMHIHIPSKAIELLKED